MSFVGWVIHPSELNGDYDGAVINCSSLELATKPFFKGQAKGSTHAAKRLRVGFDDASLAFRLAIAHAELRPAFLSTRPSTESQPLDDVVNLSDAKSVVSLIEDKVLWFDQETLIHDQQAQEYYLFPKNSAFLQVRFCIKRLCF